MNTCRTMSLGGLVVSSLHVMMQWGFKWLHVKLRVNSRSVFRRKCETSYRWKFWLTVKKQKQNQQVSLQISDSTRQHSTELTNRDKASEPDPAFSIFLITAISCFFDNEILILPFVFVNSSSFSGLTQFPAHNTPWVIAYQHWIIVICKVNSNLKRH